MKKLFASRNFLLMISANLLSHVGSGITMIGVPWYMVNQSGGATILGTTTFISTALLLFTTPYTGILIDRFSRKKLQMVYNLAGFVMMGLFGWWGWMYGDFFNWQLSLIFMSGILYYNFHFPTLTALNQELFSGDQYRTINSVKEVVSQSSAMLSGALGSILIMKWGLPHILLLDATTYLAAFMLYRMLDYQPSFQVKAGNAPERLSVWSDIKAGWHYLSQKPLMIIFFLSSFMPFIAVMVTNYLFPVYIAGTLKADGSIFAMAELIYAIGAILAGLTIHTLTRKWGSVKTILTTATTFMIAMFLIALIPSATVFLALKVVLGWGNAGTRINRSTLIMEIVPKHLIGRVNSFFQVIGIILRVTLIGMFTIAVPYTGASFLILVLGLMILLAIFGIWYSRQLVISQPESGTKFAKMEY
ncbi:MAG: MFS transporter [Bacillaceae bacterium]|nr:MFS transporter [Bacillaceae bacterium]